MEYCLVIEQEWSVTLKQIYNWLIERMEDIEPAANQREFWRGYQQACRDLKDKFDANFTDGI